MLIADADWDSIMGNATGADYDVITGGYYADAQDPWTALDNGLINNGQVGTGDGGAAYKQYATAPAGGSSYTPPGWWQNLTGFIGAAGNVATSVAPIINGKPAISPSAAGQLNTTGAATVSYGGFPIMWIVAAAIGLLALLFLRRR